MSDKPEPGSSFTFSLKTLLIVLLAVGTVIGLLARLFSRNAELCLLIVSVLTTLVPFLAGIGTIIWLGVRGKRRGLVLWGCFLLLLPMIGTGTLFVAQYFLDPSPGGLANLSTQQLVQQRLPKQIDEPWVWNELEDRLAAGSLPQENVEAAVKKLISHMTTTRPNGWDQPLSWQRDFVGSAIQAGMLPDTTLIRLCDAFYGPQPVFSSPPRTREGETSFQIELEYGNSWSNNSGLDIELLWDVQRVLLDGQAVDFQQIYKHDRRWSGRYVGALAAGDHELTAEVQCAYVDQDKLLGLDVNKLPPELWPKARKRWTQTVSAPLKVYAKDVPLVTSR